MNSEQSPVVGTQKKEVRERFEPLPSWLSCFEKKIKAYRSDRFFEEGWSTLGHLQSIGAMPIERLWTLGSVLFKADALIRGNWELGLRFLEAQGFAVRAFREVVFWDDRVDDLWRYSLGRLSPERVDLLKRLQRLCPSLYVIVETEGEHRLPCSLRVTEMKGQVEVSKRHSGNLRFAMGSPQSAFFNFVHSADEPADLVRELGLLFRANERLALILEAVSGSRPRVESGFRKLSLKCRHSDLDYVSAIYRLSSNISACDHLCVRDREEMLRALSRLREDGYGSWLDLGRSLRVRTVTIDDLDDIVIGSALIPMKCVKPTQLFPSCESRFWRGDHPSKGASV